MPAQKSLGICTRCAHRPARHRLPQQHLHATVDKHNTAIAISRPGMASTSSSKAYFEHQRSLLLTDIAGSLENVLQNINRLNRSLEGVIAVCQHPCVL